MKKTKEEKAYDKLAALLGMDAPPPKDKASEHESTMEGEAALEYFENPRTFKEKKCKHCGREFATRGAPVAYCSNPCRIKTFEERMGVRWQPDRSLEARWGFYGEPLILGPEALQTIKAVHEAQPEPDSLGPIIDEWPGYGDSPEPEGHRVELWKGGQPPAKIAFGPDNESPDLDDDTLDILRSLGLD